MVTLAKLKKAVAHLPSFITDEDLACYLKYANKIDKGTIIDLGTGWGKSALALGLSNPENIVLTIDNGAYPIYQQWAKDLREYTVKLHQIFTEAKARNIIFLPQSAEESNLVGTCDLLHIDNWVEINTVDSSQLLTMWFERVKPGGYILVRNYGHGSRDAYTASVDKATSKFKILEQIGMIQVYQV